MTDTVTLQQQLNEAKFQLKYASPVRWDAIGPGLADFNHKQALVIRLQSELNQQLKEEG